MTKCPGASIGAGEKGVVLSAAAATRYTVRIARHGVSRTASLCRRPMGDLRENRTPHHPPDTTELHHVITFATASM